MISDDSQLEYSPGNMLTLDEAAQSNGCLASVVYDEEPCIHVSVLDLYTSKLIPIANALSSNEELNDVPR
jgi:hypothetical protein